MAETSEKVLVIKHGALGDIVQAMDGFASLRAKHKKAHLAVLTTKPFAGLLATSPYFDEVLVDDRAPIVAVMRWLAIRRLLRSGWSRIYDFQCSSRTRRYFRYFIRPTGAEFIGTATGASHPVPDYTGVNNRDRMLAIAGLGGCEPVSAELDWLGAEAKPTLPRQPYAVLVPGCSPAKPRKRWPHFTELALKLASCGLVPLLVGTRLDQKPADAILAAAPMCRSLIGMTGLESLAAVFRHARLVVGNDTGPVFLAARMDVPTLMLMGRDTDPAMSAPIGAEAHWMRKEEIADISASEVVTRLAGIGALADAKDQTSKLTPKTNAQDGSR